MKKNGDILKSTTEVVNAEQPHRFFLVSKIQVLSLFFKVWLLAFILFCLIVSGLAGLFYYTWWYHFKLSAHLTDQQVFQLAKDSYNTQVSQQSNHKNILLLGTDALANRSGDPVLTDTIMIFSLNMNTGKLKAISLPRDLWTPEYKTKINALYEYGKQRYPNEPQRFPTEVISELTQVSFQNTMIVSLDQLSELIDDMGGVPVNVTEGFVDEQFPRSDVDIRTEHDPKKLYEFVVFTPGVEIMNGERALQFVRSRHSTQLDQGTDNARSIRQQQVINAIITKLKQESTLKNPVTLGKLFAWYERNFEQQLSIKELLKIGYLLQSKVSTISLQSQNLSFELDGQSGVITHPSEKKYNQWVYEIKDLEAFRREVALKLSLSQ